ncbi:MAG: hypothetical protein FJX03_05530 [Alphaproteobacteria bacterium]|nr:hypothetical protein [Alphaproteobacteria bacterium]
MTQDFPPTKYPYKPKVVIMLLGVLFFGCAAWLLAYEAQTNDQGITLVFIRHIIELTLGATQATYMLWILTVLGAVLALFCLCGLYLSLISKAELVLTIKSITIPNTGIFSFKKGRTILFKDIHSLEILIINKNRFLRIIDSNGKVDIASSMLPKKGMLDEIYNKISDCKYNSSNAK